MTVYLRLRSATSGPAFVGENEGDTLLWSVAEQKFYVGPGGGGGGGVSSFNARTGVVVPLAGDYDSDQVSNASTVSGASVSDALDDLQTQIDNIPGGGSVSSVFARTGAVVAQSGDYNSDQVTNGSGVSGSSVSDALNNLQSSSTKLATGANLTDADQTLATSQRYVMSAGTTSATRTKTLTPSATAARGFQIEVGTQGNDVILQNGGPGGTAGLFSYTVPAGQRQAVFFVGDGTNVSVTAAMPLAVEPTA